MPLILLLAQLSLGDLSSPAHYLSWGFIQISMGNLVVILIMILVFILALVLPFPKDRESS